MASLTFVSLHLALRVGELSLMEWWVTNDYIVACRLRMCVLTERVRTATSHTYYVYTFD